MNKIETLSEKIAIILIGLSPFFMYIGRGLFNVLLALLPLLFLFSHRHIPFIKQSSTLFKIVALYLFFVPFLAISGSQVFPFQDIFNSIVMVIVLFIVHKELEYSNIDNNIELFLKTFFYSMSAIATILCASYLTDINLFQSIKKLALIPYSDSFFHSQQTFLISGLALYLYYFLTTQKSAFKLFCLIAIIASTFASCGRTAIITMATGAIVFFYIYTLKNVKRWIKISVLGLLMFGTLFSVSYISSGEILDIDKIHTSGRFDGYITYIKYTIANAPWFGFGVDGGKMLYNMNIIQYKHPHNISIEVLVSTGIVGLVLLVAWLGSLFLLIAKYYKSTKSRLEKALISSTFAMFFISSQGFWSIWNKHHVIVMFLYIFVCVAIIQRASKKEVI